MVEEPAAEQKKGGNMSTVLLAVVLSVMLLTLVALAAYLILGGGWLKGGGSQDPTGYYETEPDTGAEDPTEEATDPVQMQVMGYGVAIRDGVQIKTSADDSAAPVRVVNTGDRLALYRVDGDWAMVDGGWVFLDSLYVEGDNGLHYGEINTVIGNVLNIRQGPGMDYEVVDSISIGNPITIKEEVCVGGVWWGYTSTGWVCMDYVYRNQVATVCDTVMVAVGDVVNIRRGPGTEYEVTDKIQQYDQVRILKEISVDGETWGCTDQGWINLEYLEPMA